MSDPEPSAATIPIRNIYYLLCYAWGHLREGNLVDVRGIPGNGLADLFAHVLVGGTNHLLRRGLDRGYSGFSEERAVLRGKIEVSATAKRALAARARVHCQFDELSHDVLHNRILKSTLGRLARVRDLDRDLRSRLLGLYRRMDDVREIPLSRMAFRRVQIHRNNAFYDFLMSVCELVVENLLADERTGERPGEYRFRDFLRDEQGMNRLFEKFVRRFFAVEQSTFSVSSDRIGWDAVPLSAGAAEALPAMRTDMTLRSAARTIVIDTKFYRRMHQVYYDKPTIHSPNLYQIFAYLKNLEPRGGNDAVAEGMLLYPVVTGRIDHRYLLQGHRVRVCTVDLAQEWQGIRSELLGLLVA